MPPKNLLPDPFPPTSLNCPACTAEQCRSLGAIRYGNNAVVADQDASRLVREIGRKELMECQICGFRWTHPYDFHEAVIALYRQNQETHWDAPGRDWSRYSEPLRSRLPAGGKALDVGCYNGGFLAELGPEWERHGIEPIPYAAQRARERGIQVFEGLVEAADYPPASFDLITLWDVAEHLTHPYGTLQRLVGWLKPGGLLALETGNAECWFARFMGRDWWYVALLEHCSFYTVDSLRQLFNRAGLELDAALPTSHHHMSLPKKAVQLAKAGLYRAVSAGESSGAFWATHGLPARILQRHAPCLLLRDHLYVIARAPLSPKESGRLEAFPLEHENR